MAYVDKEIIITEDAARGGVTGHNVRYVLVYGLVGIVAAFAAIAIYNGFDTLSARLSQAVARDPASVLWDAMPYVLGVVLGALIVHWLLSLWSLISGPSDDALQTGMRTRVVVQFTVICLMMTALYFAVF